MAVTNETLMEIKHAIDAGRTNEEIKEALAVEQADIDSARAQ